MSRIVLIVDDDPVQCRLAEAAMARAGWSTLICTNGTAALGVLTRPDNESIAVVLLDLVMEGGGGIALLKAMRKAGIRIPVVVQTAKTDIESVIEAMREGAVDLIVKPGSPERIRSSIEAADRRDRLARDETAAQPVAETAPPAHRPASAVPAAPDDRMTRTARSDRPTLAPGLLDLLDAAGDIRPLDDIEADIIALAMDRYGGRPAVVARRMGIGRSTLYRKLRGGERAD